MHIILGDQITEELTNKYTVLELDNFRRPDAEDTISAYCVVENVPISELPQAHHYQELHAQLIKNYRQGNWKFCQDALAHLMGRWNGEVDSFYRVMLDRVQHSAPSKDWDPAIQI